MVATPSVESTARPVTTSRASSSNSAPRGDRAVTRVWSAISTRSPSRLVEPLGHEHGVVHGEHVLAEDGRRRTADGVVGVELPQHVRVAAADVVDERRGHDAAASSRSGVAPTTTSGTGCGVLGGGGAGCAGRPAGTGAARTGSGDTVVAEQGAAGVAVRGDRLQQGVHRVVAAEQLRLQLPSSASSSSRLRIDPGSGPWSPATEGRRTPARRGPRRARARRGAGRGDEELVPYAPVVEAGTPSPPPGCVGRPGCRRTARPSPGRRRRGTRPGARLGGRSARRRRAPAPRGVSTSVPRPSSAQEAVAPELGEERRMATTSRRSAPGAPRGRRCRRRRLAMTSSAVSASARRLRAACRTATAGPTSDRRGHDCRRRPRRHASSASMGEQRQPCCSRRARTPATTATAAATSRIVADGLARSSAAARARCGGRRRAPGRSARRGRPCHRTSVAASSLERLGAARGAGARAVRRRRHDPAPIAASWARQSSTLGLVHVSSPAHRCSTSNELSSRRLARRRRPAARRRYSSAVDRHGPPPVWGRVPRLSWGTGAGKRKSDGRRSAHEMRMRWWGRAVVRSR